MTQTTAKPSVLGPNEVEAIVREWFRTYSDKDFAAHNALIHPDCVVVYPEMCYTNPDASAGSAFLIKTLEKDEASFLDLKQTITNLWVVGDTAFVAGYFSGNKVGGTLLGQAKGSVTKLNFLDRIEIEDHKIKLVHCYYDTALFYQIQLGLDGPTKEKPIPQWMVAMSGKQNPAAARSN